jgi:2-phospho-L-lactate guanylyltransferase
MVRSLADIAVISPAPVELEIAREEHCQPFLEERPAGLNRALAHVLGQALAFHVSVVMVVPIDLPLIQPEDLAAVLGLARLSAHGRHPLVIAPDRHGTGTNLMAFHLPASIELRYGRDSYKEHRAQCKEHNLTCFTLKHPHLALDLDLPADIDFLRKLNWSGELVSPPAKGFVGIDRAGTGLWNGIRKELV